MCSSPKAPPGTLVCVEIRGYFRNCISPLSTEVTFSSACMHVSLGILVSVCEPATSHTRATRVANFTKGTT